VILAEGLQVGEQMPAWRAGIRMGRLINSSRISMVITALN
jgi:hypothetical protein